MYIELDTLVWHIEGFSTSFLDPNTYTLYYEYELPPDICTSEMLQVPKIDVRIIVTKFIKNYRIFRYKRIDYTQHLDKFHIELNNQGIYDEWCDFRWNYLCDFASNWCNSNNIEFSKKCK